MGFRRFAVAELFLPDVIPKHDPITSGCCRIRVASVS
jgi:hypothetical protein